MTLGVLMALAAQQLVERLSSQDRAVRARERIEYELESNQGSELERVAIRTCLTDRLRELATGLANGRSRWTSLPELPYADISKPALAAMYRVPSRVWLTDAYDEALAQGDLKDLSPDQRSGLVPLYTQIKYMGALNDEEQRLETTLAPLQFGPTLSSSERNSFIATIARLDQVNSAMVQTSRQTFKKYRQLGYTDTPQEIAEFHRSQWWEKTLADYRSRYGSCVDARAIAEIDPALLPTALK